MEQSFTLAYSPCMSSLYRGVSLEEQLRGIREQGFSYVECWQLGDMVSQGLPQLLQKYQLELSAFCPDYFVLNDPAQRETYRKSLVAALGQTANLGTKELITQVGQDTGCPRAEQHQAIVEGLRQMAPLLEAQGVTLLIEPLNTVRDHKGYYLSSSQEAFDIVDEVGSPCVKVLFDLYHQLHMGEDVETLIWNNLPRIGHFHLAGFPNRDEQLFTGAFDHTAFLARAKAEGITQKIGLEFMPSSGKAREELFRALPR